MPTCDVEVSTKEIQIKVIHGYEITTNKPHLAFDIQPQEEAQVLGKNVLDQPSNKFGSYFLKVALEEYHEVLKRASCRIHNAIIQAKEHLKVLVLVKAKAFDRAGVG